MTIVHSTVTRTKPGRLQDAIAGAVEAKKLFERIGAPDSRLLMAQIAGEQSGSGVFVTEFASGEEWGAFNDALYADTELQAFAERFDGDGSPVMMESTSVGSVVDLGRAGSTATGAVVQSYISRPTPGGSAAMLALANATFDFVEANGATNCRMMTLDSSGAMSGCVVAVVGAREPEGGRPALRCLVQPRRSGDRRAGRVGRRRLDGDLEWRVPGGSPLAAGLLRAVQGQYSCSVGRYEAGRR